jgi:DNA replication and repair protein RecF
VELSWIEISDFRCYRALELRPEPGVNVLVGRNGAGKTSVLEAIGYLSSLRSFRRTPDAALVRSGASTAVLRGGVTGGASEVRVEVEIPVTGRRTVRLNGKRPARHADVPAAVPLVAFLPDDLDLVKRGPALRREYLDDLAARLSPAAGADLGEYERALRQRNAMLRRDGRGADPLTLDVWDEQLAQVGARVLCHRLRVLDKAAPRWRDAYRSVGGEGDDLAVRYQSSWAGPVGAATARQPEPHVGALRSTLADRRGRDLDRRTTTSGPHRDDPSLVLADRDLRTQASQGEQRSAALALRIAAYGLLEERHGRPPILLLDDVLSELDPGRAAGVMQLLPRGQVFVTTARDDEAPDRGARWNVRSATVVRNENVDP